MTTQTKTQTTTATWTKAGDYVAGTVTAIREVDGQYGPTTVVQIGKTSVFCGLARLKQLAVEAQVGDRICVTYLGEVTTSRGRQMKDFTVERGDIDIIDAYIAPTPKASHGGWLRECPRCGDLVESGERCC